jgi:hypothetical protein
VLGVAATLLLVPSLLTGQVFEETMEPDELGIGDIDSLVVPPSGYVGNAACMTCHQSAYDRWIGTKHARAFVELRSRLSMMMAREAGVTAGSPARSGKCLACHATAHDVPAAFRGPEFRMGEGVTCEKCHGPGQRHLEAVAAGDKTASIELPGQAVCMACHRLPSWHKGEKGSEPFYFTERWKRIAH